MQLLFAPVILAAAALAGQADAVKTITRTVYTTVTSCPTPSATTSARPTTTVVPDTTTTVTSTTTTRLTTTTTTTSVSTITSTTTTTILVTPTPQPMTFTLASNFCVTAALAPLNSNINVNTGGSCVKYTFGADGTIKDPAGNCLSVFANDANVYTLSCTARYSNGTPLRTFTVQNGLLSIGGKIVSNCNPYLSVVTSASGTNGCVPIRFVPASN